MLRCPGMDTVICIQQHKNISTHCWCFHSLHTKNECFHDWEGAMPKKGVCGQCRTCLAICHCSCTFDLGTYLSNIRQCDTVFEQQLAHCWHITDTSPLYTLTHSQSHKIQPTTATGNIVEKADLCYLKRYC